MVLLSIVTAAAWAAYLILSRLPHDLHMLQQNSYRNDRYLRWYKQHYQGELRLGELCLPLALLLCCFSPLAGLLLFLVFLALLTWWQLTHKKAVIKPLVMTDRAKRLRNVAVMLIVCGGAILAALWCWAAGMGWPGRILAPFTMLLALAWCHFSALFTYKANFLLAPMEKKINLRYYRQAQQRIADLPALHRVGITGSYGKTSVKKIADAILSEQYLTLATPESYNTPMGITRVIREQLRPIHQVFIAEMGARQKGDIQELAQLVSPQIGVLTAIGPQHLETFGSIETIAETKFELIRALPRDGVAILNMDDPLIAAHRDWAPCKVVSYGLSEGCDFRATQISYTGQGGSFVLCHGQEQVAFSTKLLGSHNICNILAGVAVAYQLGVPLALAARAVKRLAPVSHRLELKQLPKYLMLDDAFNANPVGAQAALQVLQAMEGGQKIIITPGMVELGEQEKELNLQFAAAMTKVADYIILVGQQRGKMLEEALVAANFPQKRYYIAADLRDARIRLSQIVQSSEDIVLYENDLPDLY